MMLLHSLSLLLAASFVAAAPKPQSVTSTDVTATSPVVTLTATRTSSQSPASSQTSAVSGDACAALASRVRAARVPYPTVPAKAAWDCLQAVPYDANTAESFLRSLSPYFRWQTTLNYNKNPPPSYQLPAYDFYAAYDTLLSNVRNRTYRNEYDFEFDIYRLLQRVHDGHFNYLPNLVNRVVSFGRPFSLVSVSSNGQDLPKPYVYADVLLSYNRSGFNPSAVTQINGQNVTSYLTNFSYNSQYQDPDALYNALFLELAAIQLGSGGNGPGTISGGGRGDLIYPNETTTLTFENGTTVTFENIALMTIPFGDITSAQNLYQRWINPNRTVALGEATNTSAVIPAPGYPAPVLRSRNNYAGGYYLNSSGYEDVAVLALASFLNTGSAESTALAFLNRAIAAGKTKLIIDLQANGGGSIEYGYTIFTRLFPNIRPYLGSRFRANEVFDIIGQTASDFSNGSTTYNRAPYYAFFDGRTPFVYASDLTENYTQFPSWAAKFGPHQFQNDNFTSIIQWNTSQPYGVYVNKALITNATTPPFRPENIILLTDGFCASTCSNFVQMMTGQAGVKTVTVGGRPNSTAMQSVGGTRGSNNYGWTLVSNYATLALSLANYTRGRSYAVNLSNNTQLGQYVVGGQTGYDALAPSRRGTGGNLNVRDNIPRNDTAQVPLQFMYQAADCRIFYTKDMTVDITALWKEVYDVTWNGARCVSGGIRNGTAANLPTTNSPQVTRRSAEQRIFQRAIERRAFSQEDLSALLAGQDVWTVHDADLSAGGVVIP